MTRYPRSIRRLQAYLQLSLGNSPLRCVVSIQPQANEIYFTYITLLTPSTVSYRFASNPFLVVVIPAGYPRASFLPIRVHALRSFLVLFPLQHSPLPLVDARDR